VPGIRDLRGLLWSSIDNDTSKDLDQIEVADRAPSGIRVLVELPTSIPMCRRERQSMGTQRERRSPCTLR